MAATLQWWPRFLCIYESYVLLRTSMRLPYHILVQQKPTTSRLWIATSSTKTEKLVVLAALRRPTRDVASQMLQDAKLVKAKERTQEANTKRKGKAKAMNKSQLIEESNLESQ